MIGYGQKPDKLQERQTTPLVDVNQEEISTEELKAEAVRKLCGLVRTAAEIKVARLLQAQDYFRDLPADRKRQIGRLTIIDGEIVERPDLPLLYVATIDPENPKVWKLTKKSRVTHEAVVDRVKVGEARRKSDGSHYMQMDPDIETEELFRTIVISPRRQAHNGICLREDGGIYPYYYTDTGLLIPGYHPNIPSDPIKDTEIDRMAGMTRDNLPIEQSFRYWGFILSQSIEGIV